MNIDPERVGFRVNIVNLRRVFQLLQDVSRANAPSVHFDGDESGWVIVGLEKVIGVNVGGQVGCNQLRILATGLAVVSAAFAASGAGGLEGCVRRRCLCPSDRSSDH